MITWSATEDWHFVSSKFTDDRGAEWHLTVEAWPGTNDAGEDERWTDIWGVWLVPDDGDANTVALTDRTTDGVFNGTAAQARKWAAKEMRAWMAENRARS